MAPSAAQEAGGDAGSASVCSGTCSVTGPMTVSAIQQPVTVTASQPLPISGAVAVSGIAGPVTVSVPTPITVAGPLKVITADTDLSRMVIGNSAGATDVRALGTGPLVLTDAVCNVGIGRPDNTTTCSISIIAGATCPTWIDPFRAAIALDSTNQMHGGRYAVPAGSVACGVANYGVLYWAGFRPY